MRREQLTRQCQMLRMIESRKQDVRVSQLAEAGGPHPQTIWPGFPATQTINFSRLLSKRYLKENIWHSPQMFKKDNYRDVLISKLDRRPPFRFEGNI